MSGNHPAIDPEVRRRIGDRLAEIEQRESVRILLAVESGSRAWGFPSPDSDYDVRFLYARPRDWYLAVDSRRDVIECPIENVLDVNGWDIRKALQLLLKANPVLAEWLNSPIRYREDALVVAALRELAMHAGFRRSAAASLSPARPVAIREGRRGARYGAAEDILLRLAPGACPAVAAHKDGSAPDGPAVGSAPGSNSTANSTGSSTT